MKAIDNKTFSNHEVVTLAVYLLGGERQAVDTEDVAVKANELAPGRFTWRKHRDQINLEIIRVYLSDAKKPSKGSYLLGSGNDGWLLTPEGLSFAVERLPDLGRSDLTRAPLSSREQRQRQVERTRMLGSDAFAKFKAQGIQSVTKVEAESFFRLNEYVVDAARERKLSRLVNTYGDDAELGEAVAALARRIRGE